MCTEYVELFAGRSRYRILDFGLRNCAGTTWLNNSLKSNRNNKHGGISTTTQGYRSGCRPYPFSSLSLGVARNTKGTIANDPPWDRTGGCVLRAVPTGSDYPCAQGISPAGSCASYSRIPSRQMLAGPSCLHPKHFCLPCAVVLWPEYTRPIQRIPKHMRARVPSKEVRRESS